jgi:hypothetical protein
MGLRPAKPHEKQSRVAQTCRSLACLRPCPEGAYIPPKYGGTYAPPWFFDPAALTKESWCMMVRFCHVPGRFARTYSWATGMPEAP